MQANNMPLQLMFTDARMAALVDAIDDLHSAVVEQRLQQVSPLTRKDMIDWLNELIFLAQETVTELDASTAHAGLQLVAKSEAS
jgi:gluconate kinase